MPPVEYSNRIFDLVLEWYKNADSKAQMILALDGVLVTFLTSSIFMEPVHLSRLIVTFGSETWVLLFLMCFTFTISIVSALISLWSRIYSEREVKKMFKQAGVIPGKAETYKPEFLFFFQFLSKLSEVQLAEKLFSVNDSFVIEALAHELPILSNNVMKKHKWVNIGFISAGASLIFLLSVGISYVARL